MQVEKLRSLIRESINEYIQTIDEAGTRAMYEAKMKACDDAMDARKKKIEMAESLEEMQGMFDESKINELKKEMKMLEKQKAKYGKMLEKMNKGKKVVTEEPTGEAPVDEADVTAEMEMKDEALNESFLKMQKLAGVITEGQYRKKVQMLSEGFDDFNGPNWSARIKEIAKGMGYDVDTGWDDSNVDRARLQAADEAKKGEKKAYLGMIGDDTIVATFTLNQQEKEQNKADIQKKVIDVYKNDADVKTTKETHGDTIMQVMIKAKAK